MNILSEILLAGYEIRIATDLDGESAICKLSISSPNRDTKIFGAVTKAYLEKKGDSAFSEYFGYMWETLKKDEKEG